MDIPLEIRLFCEDFGLLKQRFMAPGLDNPSLMEGQGTETASPKAAAAAGQTEFDLREGRHTSCFLIGRMPGTHKGQRVDIIHLCLTQWFCRRILHEIHIISIGFGKPLS